MNILFSPLRSWPGNDYNPRHDLSHRWRFSFMSADTAACSATTTCTSEDVSAIVDPDGSFLRTARVLDNGMEGVKTGESLMALGAGDI